MLKKLCCLLVVFVLSSCASVEKQTPQKVVAPKKLSVETIARILPQPVSQLNYDLLIALTNTHSTPEAMIAELEKDPAGYDLTPTQILSLHAAGIDASVLDYLHSRSQTATEMQVNQVFGEYQTKVNKEIGLLRRQLSHASLMSSPYCRGGAPRIYPRRINGRIYFGNSWYY